MDVETRKELFFVLEARTTDIREWKQEQWRYGYTALVALAGLIASVRVPSVAPTCSYKLLVILGALGVAAIWWIANHATENALKRTRQGVARAYELLAPAVLATRPDGMRQNQTVPRTLSVAVFGLAAFAIAATAMR